MALTRAQIEAHFAALFNYAETESSYLSTRVDTLDSNLLSIASGDRFNQSLSAAKAWRTLASQALAANVVSPLVAPQWTEVADFLNLPLDTSFRDLFYAFRDNMITNSKTIKGRNLILGSPAASGGNTGTGELLRLKVDDNDQNIEACHVESQRLDIIADQSDPRAQGRHNELGYFTGSTNPLDLWKVAKLTVSGLTQQLKVSSESDSLLQNPSFDQFTPFESPFVGPLTALTGWTILSGLFTALSIDTVNFFTSNTGASKPASLKFTASETISQFLTITQRFDYRVPCVPVLYYNRSVGAATGSFTVTWGSKSQTVVLAAEAGWVRFPIVFDKKLYPKNWLTDKPEFKIAVTLTGGTLLFDKVIFKPLSLFDAGWFILTGGITPYITGDFFTWANTFVSIDSIIQKWLGILYQLSLPFKTDGTQTWADPVVIP